MNILILLPIALMLGYGLWKNNRTPHGIGIKNGKVTQCGSTPNCVSSSGPKTRYIEPLPYLGSQSLSLILEFLKKHYKTKVIKENSTYLHVVISTDNFHFKDDLEFLLKPDKGVIEVRSASRVGYSDMGVNQMRLDKLKVYLESL